MPSRRLMPLLVATEFFLHSTAQACALHKSAKFSDCQYFRLYGLVAIWPYPSPGHGPHPTFATVTVKYFVCSRS